MMCPIYSFNNISLSSKKKLLAFNFAISKGNEFFILLRHSASQASLIACWATSNIESIVLHFIDIYKYYIYIHINKYHTNIYVVESDLRCIFDLYVMKALYLF